MKAENQRIEYEEHFCDREQKINDLGEGEWAEEPDYVTWIYKGIRCLMKRNNMGAWCGYCQIPVGHAFDNPMKKIEMFGIELQNIENYSEWPIEVHGGLTYAERDKDDRAWMGFDCSHSMDIAPGMEKTRAFTNELMKEKYPKIAEVSDNIFRGTYKTKEFVILECESMVDQMLEIKKLPDKSQQ